MSYVPDVDEINKLEEEEEIENGEDESQNSEDVQFHKDLSKVFLYLEEKGLQVKDASYGKTRVEYVRGDEMVKSINDNLEYLVKEVNTLCETEIDPKAKDAAQCVYDEFNMRGMLVKAVRFKDDGKVKYPRRLTYYEEEDEEPKAKKGLAPEFSNKNVSDEKMAELDEKFFYILDIHRDKKKTYFWLFVLIFVILMYCLFPVWPYEVKVGIWWVSYIFLVAICCLIVIRLVLQYFLYIFGLDFWLLPDLFNEKLGVVDSFRVIYSLNKRTETLFTLVIRAACTLSVLYLCWTVYDNPQTINDFSDHLAEIYNDAFEYGKDAIVSYGNSTALNLKNPQIHPFSLDEEDEF